MRRYNSYSIRRRKSFFDKLSLTNLFIAINICLFLAFILASRIISVSSATLGFDNLVKYLALNPSLVLSGYIWTFISSMFMHGSFTHLFVNMVSLFFIGNFLERVIGRKRLFWFYFISGIVAGAFFVGLAYLGTYFSWGTNVFGSVDSFAVGASGALFGLGGLLAVLIPRLKVLVFFIIPMPMWLAMAVLMFGLWAISIGAGLPVGNTVHFGGLVTGVLYGFYLKSKYSKKVKALNRMFV